MLLAVLGFQFSTYIFSTIKGGIIVVFHQLLGQQPKDNKHSDAFPWS